MAVNPNFATVAVHLDIKSKLKEAAFFRGESQSKLAGKAIVAYLEATEDNNKKRGNNHGQGTD